jgi:hypothetical protein
MSVRRALRLRLAPLLAVVVLGGLSGCDDDHPLSSSEQRALAQARARWDANGGLNYTVESRIICFCPPQLAQWTRLTVRAGVVVEAVPVESLPDGLEPMLQGWQTVEELFEIIASPSSVVANIDVTFDPTLGYPTSTAITCGPQIADCGSTRELRNLRID